MSEHNSCEGDSACKRQAISSVSLIPSVALPSGNVWAGLQNNSNNEYNFSLADGSWNNNNKNNSYNVVPVESEELENLIFGAEEFCYFEAKYRPSGFPEWQRTLFMGMIHTMIMHDPTVNCERHSPIEMWELFIKPEKSIFGKGDVGMPIGNYYSQLLANLFLAFVCEKLQGKDVTEFVDDFAGVEDMLEEIKETEAILQEALAELNLTLHPTKKYIQPVRHGLPWCGHMIFADRMYLDNRPIHNCFWKIEHRFSEVTLANAIMLQQTVNSYTGAMCHIREWNTQMRVMNAVFDAWYGKYVYFKEKPNHLICELKKEYTPERRSMRDIEEIDEFLFNTKYRVNMIFMPIKADSPHFERKGGRFIYRYGYQPIAESDGRVQACIEELRIRLKEPAIRKKVTEYCASVGIPNEYDPADYGFNER